MHAGARAVRGWWEASRLTRARTWASVLAILRASRGLSGASGRRSEPGGGLKACAMQARGKHARTRCAPASAIAMEGAELRFDVCSPEVHAVHNTLHHTVDRVGATAADAKDLQDVRRCRDQLGCAVSWRRGPPRERAPAGPTAPGSGSPIALQISRSDHVRPPHLDGRLVIRLSLRERLRLDLAAGAGRQPEALITACRASDDLGVAGLPRPARHQRSLLQAEHGCVRAGNTPGWNGEKPLFEFVQWPDTTRFKFDELSPAT